MTGDLENLSEMVAETLEASKDQQRESATSENNMCMCRICNLICAEKATFQREKCQMYKFPLPFRHHFMLFGVCDAIY